jgi:Ribbon-helix-helix domain
MSKGGKTQRIGEAEAFEFSLGTKRKLKAQRKEWVLANSENLRVEFMRLRDKIDWELLRHASNQDDVKAALSAVDQFTRERLPNAAAILATVRDPDYPKLRPIRFLAESCALAHTYPNSGDRYSPRYSRDVCYLERKRRGPVPKPITELEYWQGQAELGQKVPRKYVRRINKREAQEQARSHVRKLRTNLTYVDIPETMGGVKKKRTTVWLPETTVAKLKKLSAVTGAPIAELFRRAVEAYLKTS